MSATIADLQLQAARDLQEGEVVRLGSCKAQALGGSHYGVYPEPFAAQNEIVQGAPLAVAYHPATRSIILTPVPDDVEE
jgi:hypothetical protein